MDLGLRSDDPLARGLTLAVVTLPEKTSREGAEESAHDISLSAPLRLCVILLTSAATSRAIACDRKMRHNLRSEQRYANCPRRAISAKTAISIQCSRFFASSIEEPLIEEQGRRGKQRREVANSACSLPPCLCGMKDCMMTSPMCFRFASLQRSARVSRPAEPQTEGLHEPRFSLLTACDASKFPSPPWWYSTSFSSLRQAPPKQPTVMHNVHNTHTEESPK
jgi:hypothetical protein